MVRLLGWSLSDVTQTLEASLSPAPARWALGRLSPTWTPGLWAQLPLLHLVLRFGLAPGSTLDAPFMPVPLSGSKVTLPLDDDSERLLLFAQQRSSLCFCSFSVTKY